MFTSSKVDGPLSACLIGFLQKPTFTLPSSNCQSKHTLRSPLHFSNNARISQYIISNSHSPNHPKETLINHPQSLNKHILSCSRDVRPPVTSFSPSLWVDTFSTYSVDHQAQETYAETIEALKKDVSRMLMTTSSSGELIRLIDTIERLGLAFHFEAEIEEKIEQIYNIHDRDENYDLFTTALRFRLLRQHQYHVSCDVFDILKDKENKFKESVSSDVEGLLSLYETAHVRIHGEDILEEAFKFTTHHLTRMLPQLESPLKDKVKRALEQPHHRGIPIIEIRVYISMYEKDGSRDELLLKLAKVNFNYLQNLYKKEIFELSRWWDKFDLKSKLPYARDRLIESFLVGASFHFEPQYSHLRISMGKLFIMMTVMDDTYDNYATLEEAQLFTDILEKWDMEEIDRLPDYMKVFYRFIMSIYEDYECDAIKQDKSFALPYYREKVKQLAGAYNQDLKLVMERQIPSFEEFMKISMNTSAVHLMLIALVPSIKSWTKESIDWLMSDPQILVSTAKLGRFIDDMGTHERENKGGTMLTTVDYYMKQYGVSNKQEAVSILAEQVEDEWKYMNKEWVMIRMIPKEIVVQFLNYVRTAEVLYKKFEDGFTYPEKALAPQIVATFVDPI